MEQIWFNVPLCSACMARVDPERQWTHVMLSDTVACSRCDAKINNPIYVRVCFPLPEEV